PLTHSAAANRGTRLAKERPIELTFGFFFRRFGAGKLPSRKVAVHGGRASMLCGAARLCDGTGQSTGQRNEDQNGEGNQRAITPRKLPHAVHRRVWSRDHGLVIEIRR